MQKVKKANSALKRKIARSAKMQRMQIMWNNAKMQTFLSTSKNAKIAKLAKTGRKEQNAKKTRGAKNSKNAKILKVAKIADLIKI